MKIDKLNRKIDGFFEALNKKRIQKTATLGNFIDVKGDDEMVKEANMTKEMLSLPKYEEIISRLKAATGIVNFVTHDEYQPLVELLIKKVFPASNSDIFNFPTLDKLAGKSPSTLQQQKADEYYYNQVDLEREYFVSPQYFAKNAIQGVPGSVLPARGRLENLLLGTKAKLTRKYLETELGMTKDMIEKRFGREPTPEEMQRMVDERASASDPRRRAQPQQFQPAVGLTPKGQAMAQYEAALREIEERYDGTIRDLNRQIFDVYTGAVKFPNPEDFEKIKKQREGWIKDRREMMEALNDGPIGAALDVESLTGGIQRNNDGFINYNPKNNVIVQSKELWSKVVSYKQWKTHCRENNIKIRPEEEKEKEGEILHEVKILKRQLEDAYTSNPNLKIVKDQWLAFLGNGTHADFGRIVSGILGIYTQLDAAYKKIAQQTGKVLILDDFDKSALCIREPKDDSIQLEGLSRGIFLDFVGKNASNLERDNSIGQKAAARGNRVVVVVSSKPISNLPASSIIEMNMTPVDKQEAEIIVRNLFKTHIRDARNTLLRKKYRELQEKYPDYMESEEARAEEAKIQEGIDDQNEALINISEDTKKKLINQIIGLGQKDAIDAVRTAISIGIKRIGPDIVNEKIEFDDDRIVKDLKDNVGGKLSSGVKGLAKIDREIDFEDYAYEKGSDWSVYINTVKKAIDYLKYLRSVYETNKGLIKGIDRKLRVSDSASVGQKGKLSSQEIQALMEERKNLISYNAQLDKEIEDNCSAHLPHFYMLYGEPGVGKTVWGSALADLLRYNLYKIDISDQKNKWVGNTEANARVLLSYLKKAQDCVFILDEIDRQLATSDAGSEHQVDKELVAKLLEFFGNRANDELFVKNRVYFVMTTNHIDQVNAALRSRAKVEVEVPEPKSAEAFESLINSAIKKFGKDYPETPISSINWKAFANALVQKSIGFRFLENTIKQALDLDKDWRNTMKLFKNGQLVDPQSWESLGLPLTLPNLLELAEIISTGKTSALAQLVAEKGQQIKSLVEPYLTGKAQFETVQSVNPYTNKPEPQLKLPDSIEKVMTGSDKSKAVPEGEMSAEGWEFKREVDPETGRVKTDLKPKVEPAKEMEKLRDTGFSELPLVEEQPLSEQEKHLKEQSPKKKKKEDMDKKPSQKQEQAQEVKSSTDYLFGYLQKQGLIENNQFVGKRKTEETKPLIVAKRKAPQIDPTDELAEKGIFYFGGLLVAPVTPETPPQKLKSFQR